MITIAVYYLSPEIEDVNTDPTVGADLEQTPLSPGTDNSLEIPAVGQIITFGHYEQEGKTGTGVYPVYWRVLKVEDKKVFLLSDRALACKYYHDFDENVTWETCTLRYWLNHDFYDIAFSNAEKEKITLSDVENNAGNDTRDHIFLLSLEELNQFFSTEVGRQCAATDHAAQDQGAYVDDSTGACWWWLRSQGTGEDTAVSINSDGSIDMSSRVVGKNGTVRPAMWVSFE